MQQKSGGDPEDQFRDEIQALDDNEIISRILKGEKNLYALLVRKYNQRLYRVGMSVLNNEAEVEDVMQLAYIKAYENLEKFKFQSAFSTWLTKILVNESLLHLRKKHNTVQKSKLGLSPPAEQSAVDSETPLMKVLNWELKTILESSIRELPENYRTVFIMREIENMSIAETCEVLGISEANVKVRLNRAKVMLRDMLREYLKDDEILQLYQSHCDRMVDRVMEKINRKGH
ncbi:MAG TPA: RNA polymerase sigma factor [Flavisolibacter sp.]|nr:RNA polymerase sigma factor [Flavisolibacter sp.]